MIKGKKEKIKLTLSIILLYTSLIPAQEKVDENAIFADSSSVVDSVKVVNTQAAKDDAQEKKSVGFSGEIEAYADPSINRSWSDNPTLHAVRFDTRVVGNAFIDARLIGGAKAYADLQGSMCRPPRLHRSIRALSGSRTAV